MGHADSTFNQFQLSKTLSCFWVKYLLAKRIDDENHPLPDSLLRASGQNHLRRTDYASNLCSNQCSTFCLNHGYTPWFPKKCLTSRARATGKFRKSAS